MSPSMKEAQTSWFAIWSPTKCMQVFNIIKLSTYNTYQALHEDQKLGEGVVSESAHENVCPIYISFTVY